jgi:multidrug resistance efflux pump
MKCERHAQGVWCPCDDCCEARQEPSFENGNCSECEKLRAQLAQAVANCDAYFILYRESQQALRATQATLAQRTGALQNLFALVESGVLVRNLSRDAEPGFALRQVPLIQAFTAARDILADLPDAPKGEQP